jgi:hypothetical protein
MFTSDNTEGYTAAELEALNAELAQRLADAGVEPGSDEAMAIEKAFHDEVSRR